MKNNWILIQKEEAISLISKASVSDFLGYYYQQTKKYWPSFSYAWLSKEAGISKSLLIGIFNGSKPLSAKNLPSLIKALKLPLGAAEYFEALVNLDMSSKNQRILKNLRQSFIESLDVGLNLETTISDPDFAILYAALGEEDTGVTIEEIMSKIKWTEERIRFLLNELKLKKFVKLVNNTHWKGTKKFITTVANNQNDWLPKLFLSSLERHQKIAHADFFSNEHLSLTYTFCVRSEDQVAMNAELKRMMSQLMKKYHDGDGEKIVSLILGTHSN